MRHNREDGGDHFDLLPFIAILMCTLGCLLLVTLSVASISIGATQGEGWIPVYDKHSAAKLKPILVEWDGKDLILHPQDGKPIKTAYAANQVSLASDSKSLSPELKTFIDWMVSHKATNYVLVAVRPSAFGSVYPLLDEFRSKDIGVGYEPVEQHREIHLLEGVEQ